MFSKCTTDPGGLGESLYWERRWTAGAHQPRTFLTLAVVLEKLEKYQEAEEVLEQILEIKGKNLELDDTYSLHILVKLVQILFLQWEHEESVELCRHFQESQKESNWAAQE